MEEDPIGSFDLSVNCVFTSNIDLTAKLSLDLGEQFLQISAALSALQGALGSVTLRRVSEASTSVRFSGDLKIGVAWAAGKDPLSIHISGKAHAFDRDWELGIIGVKVKEDNLRTLQNLASQLLEYIRDQFSDLVRTWISAAGTGVKTTITFIENNWKVAEQDMARLVADLKDLPVASVVEPVLREMQTTYEDARKVYETGGFQPFMAVRLLMPIYGNNPLPDRRPGDLPDMPNDIFDLPNPTEPSGGPMGIPIPRDLLDGLPGMDNSSTKPKPTPEPALAPATPMRNPFASIPLQLPFNNLKPASGGFVRGPGMSAKSCNIGEDVLASLKPETGWASEDPHTPFNKPTANTGMDIAVAQLPAWYTGEIERYLESAIIQSDSTTLSQAEAAPIHDVIHQIASFSEEEIVDISKSLRLGGLSDEDIQKAYMDSFGHDMSPQVLACI
ncbi:uncharacterized protein N7483_007942 [Penicillium malachiteum]|uniref:uncharacterized protein n=1 Tax=Penicillium malachiteum TaxID=1324776 RepID=UPI002547627C|nr:uncharacterized protein N7483_007942 [Penicillium malachiteum]KAJ5726585.1 hypothetical protein N7483_007942 [Penicillium malachiteum]